MIVPIGEWALRTACSQLAEWRAMGYPELRLAVNISARQLKQPDASGETLRSRGQERGTRRAGQNEAAISGAAIDRMPQRRKQRRQALGLVNRDAARVAAEKSFQIGSEERSVGRPFEVQVPPVRKQCSHQGALAALARAVNQYGRKRRGEAPQALRGAPWEGFHTLYY